MGQQACGLCRVVKETAGWTHKKDTLESEKAARARLETDAAELASSDMAAKAAAAQQVRLIVCAFITHTTADALSRGGESKT